MVTAGEDPRFILRRLIILAGEDIGMADPMGMVVATSAFTAFENIGLPEGVYPLTLATLYLSTAPKSNSAGGYFKALESIQNEGTGAVPTPLMDNSRDAAALGHGKGYQYPHSYPGHFIPQQYLPEILRGTHFYKPSSEGFEAAVKQRLEEWRKAQAEGLGYPDDTSEAKENDDLPADPPRDE